MTKLPTENIVPNFTEKKKMGRNVMKKHNGRRYKGFMNAFMVPQKLSGVRLTK